MREQAIEADTVTTSLLPETRIHHRYQALMQLGLDLNQGPGDSDTMLRKLQRHLAAILGPRQPLMLTFYLPQVNRLELYQLYEDQLNHTPNLPVEGMNKYILETQQTLIINHLSAEINHLSQAASSLPRGIYESYMFVPLRCQHEMLGLLSIQDTRPNAYSHEDRSVLELLANHIALALHSALLYDSISHLNETGQLLIQQFDSQSLVQTVVENMKDATNADIVILYRYDQLKEEFSLQPRIAGKLLDPDAHKETYPRSLSTLVQLAEHTEPIFAQQSMQLKGTQDEMPPVPRQPFYRREKVRSTALVPLRVEEKLVGILFVNFRQPQRFDSLQKLLIVGLAHYAAIVLKTNQVFNVLSERRIRELEILQNIDRALNNNLELNVVLRTILQLGLQHVTADQASIILLTSDRQYNSAITVGQRARERMIAQIQSVDKLGLTRWVMQHKQSVRVDNVHQDKQWRSIYRAVAAESISELDVPLLDGDEVLGAFNFEAWHERAFGQEDQQFLETLAGQAVLMIKKSQAYEREKRAAERFELLYEAGRELAKVVDHTQLTQAFETIVCIAQRQSNSPVVARCYDEETQELVLVSASPYRHQPPTPRLKTEFSFNAYNRQTCVIHDIHAIAHNIEPIQVVDPTLVSLIIVPIVFKDRYYGDIELSHGIANYFRDADITFFEALVQQLASVIYRLEITQERQDFEQRAMASEEMSAFGHATFELVHRLDNKLGLVDYYVNTICKELSTYNIHNKIISNKLEQIVQAAKGVLQLGDTLKKDPIDFNGSKQVPLPPDVLLETALAEAQVPDTICVKIAVDAHIEPLLVYPGAATNVLYNLIMNAIEAMPNGGQLTCGAHNHGRTVVLTITDTGVGIPAEQHQKIFDLFYTTKGSSGFGLWSARQKALKIHGKLQLQWSEPGQGTTFALLLPRGGNI